MNPASKASRDSDRAQLQLKPFASPEVTGALKTPARRPQSCRANSSLLTQALDVSNDTAMHRSFLALVSVEGLPRTPGKSQS